MIISYVFGEYRFLGWYFWCWNSEKNLEDIEVACYKIEGLKVSVFSSALTIHKRIQGQKELGDSDTIDNRFQQLLMVSN